MSQLFIPQTVLQGLPEPDPETRTQDLKERQDVSASSELESWPRPQVSKAALPFPSLPTTLTSHRQILLSRFHKESHGETEWHWHLAQKGALAVTLRVLWKEEEGSC